MTVCVSQVNSTTPPKRGRWIQALQGLRAVSFLGVFLCHSGVGGFACVGRFAVSVFFVLSGFLMAYRYLQKQNDPRFGFSFVWSKIRKLYSLHITAMVVSIPYYLSKVLAGACTLATLVACMVLNVGMLQVWVPWQSMYEMLNAPSWFMAPLVLSYLLFPLLLKVLRKIRSARSVLLLAIPFLVFYLAVVFVAARVQFLSSGTDLVDWLAYYFPPLRFCDFALGCVLGWLFLHRGTGRGGLFFPSPNGDACRPLGAHACLPSYLQVGNWPSRLTPSSRGPSVSSGKLPSCLGRCYVFWGLRAHLELAPAWMDRRLEPLCVSYPLGCPYLHTQFL